MCLRLNHRFDYLTNEEDDDGDENEDAKYFPLIDLRRQFEINVILI
jgi:hypothetical protein